MLLDEPAPGPARFDFLRQMVLSAAEVAEEAVAESAAQLDVLKTEVARLTARAPIDGTILRVNARAGEFAAVGKLREPLVALGNIEPLHVRVEVDETDASRFSATAPALVRARGHGGSLNGYSKHTRNTIANTTNTIIGAGVIMRWLVVAPKPQATASG